MKSEFPMKDFMFPEYYYIKKVEVQSYGAQYLRGFRFFDSIKQLIFEIGNVNQKENITTTVLIYDDENIIGFKAKESSIATAVLTDFQFMVCKRIDY